MCDVKLVSENLEAVSNKIIVVLIGFLLPLILKVNNLERA